ncbi:MAG TPA: carboxypeptidase regulatory-like domain-containing protein [Bryobacteraceae bacterium]|nr:carboxypeptidase regulatory-like domain-containing protein [Bryobacteraceae bacterium]
MSPILRRVSFLVPVLLACASIGLAQVSSLEGEVKDEHGQPLKGALVKIDRKDIKGHYQVKTDKKGHYFHAGLPLGIYKVTIEVDGQDRDSVDNVRTRLGDPLDVNFDLKAKVADQQALQKAAETGTLTKEQERQMSPEQREAIQKRMKEQQAQIQKNKALNDAFNQGKQALEAKQWDAAVEAFTKASQIDPNQHVIWGNLADAYSGLAATKTGADQEAAMNKGAEAFSKAIELKPDAAEYHNNYALLLAKMKKFDQAQAELNKAAQLDPPNAGKYYYNLGAVLVNTGQLEPAGQAFKKAIDADPNYADAQYQYGVYLVSKATTTPDGKIVPPAGTVEAFQKYLELKPTGPFADSAKGMLASIEGSVQTKYTNPDAKSTTSKKKK